jgi:YfiH family protein
VSDAPRYIRPEIFERTGTIVAAHSTRHGGVSPTPLGMNISFRVGDEDQNVGENRRRFLEGFGIAERHLAIPGQIHSATVRRAVTPGHVPECDGLITNVPGVVLSVTVADCLPILLADPETRAVGAVHAGWRGTAAGIAARAVEFLADYFGVRPSDLIAYLGPSARSCCYEVGEEVAALFDEPAVRTDQGKYYLDLRAANERQLLDCGVSPQNIESSPDCTISRPDLYHSFRRDGSRSGRMMAVIGVLPITP